MAYGSIKVDNITFTNGGVDQTVTVSGIVQSISGNITATGTIQGATIIGTSTVSGATVTGNVGVFTAITGGTAGFTTVTGATVTGTTANFVTVSGTTVTGTTANFGGVITAPTILGTTTVSGATVTGNTGQFTTITGGSAGFTTVTGATVTGTTANFTTLSGTTITGGHVTTASGTYTGNVTAAAFVPTGSTVPTNGVYLPSANNVALATNGTGKLFINATGEILLGDATDTNTYIHHPAADTIGIITGGNGVYFKSGSLGVGTSSPSVLLHLAGSAAQSARIDRTGSIAAAGENYGSIEFIGLNSTGSAPPDYSARIVAAHDSALSSTTRGSSLSFFTQFSSSNASEKMRIDSSGRVGIGTTSPSHTLTVQGGSVTESQLSLTTNATSILAGNVVGGIDFRSNDNNGIFTAAKIQAIANESHNSGVGAVATSLVFSNNTERARIDSSGRLLVGTSSSRAVELVSNTAGVNLGIHQESAGSNGTTYAGALFVRNSDNTSNYGPVIALARSRGTTLNAVDAVGSGDELGGITFAGADGTDTRTKAASIAAYVDGTPGANDMPGRLVFSTTADGASSPTERMRITSDGRCLFAQAAAASSATSSAILTAGSSTLAGAGWESYVTNTATRYHAVFSISGTAVGSISTNTASTAYNTSSDYRLKENVVPLTGAVDRLNQLQVHRFNFIADPDKTVDGFIAHEAQAVVPECVTGTKDEVDEDGNPVYQGIDQSKLVPLLTAALQEALAEIESLKARVTALEP